MSLFKNFTKHKLKDSLQNLRLNLSNWFWARRFTGENRTLTPPSDYQIVFEDLFTKPLDTKSWRYAMPWGDFHPKALYQYYDNDGTLSYVSPKGLILELRKSPKKIIKSQLPDWRQTPDIPDEFVIPVGVGFVSSMDAWQYGWFEATIQLPRGKSYWNAFWLCGKATWPPEIDIFEAYSHEGSEYQSGLSKWRNIKPNLHYGIVEEGSKTMYGAYANSVADATERLVQYACHWERDFIKIFYDGKMVFQCTDPEILKWYNKPNASQFMILGHGLHEHHTENPDESAMIVRSVRIFQKNYQS